MASNRAQILISAVDQTKTAFDSITRGLGDLTDTAKSVNGVLANLGVAVSVAGLTAMVKSAIDTGDALDEMSQRVGVSVETLSVWKPAAEQSGVSGESFEKGLRKLSTTMLEAATGSEDAARGFSAVGVEFKNQDGTLRATDQVLLDLAERFKAMPDGAEKTALAVQLFGKSEAELIPFLNQGRDGINELAAEMQALGVQMSSETAAQAGNFNDALDKLKLATTSIGNQIIASLLPALNDMAGGMVESAKQGGTLRAILDGVVLVLKTLALGAATVGKAFVALGEAIGAGVAAAVEALKGNTDGAKAIIADLKGNLVKRLDELASFRDSLFDPKPIEAKAPKIQADPELLQRLTKPKVGKAAQDTTGAQTWRSALASIFQQVADAFLQQIVIQLFQQWIAMQARMLALKLGFIQQEQTVDAAASAAKVAQKTTETTALVSMDAAKAGAGAAASQASIPIVGPGLAIAAMVAMVAAVMALLGGIKKFAGGGLVSGPGSATSDSIPARLSAGEYVVRAAAVRQVGVAFLDSLNGLSAGPRFKGGELAFAAGGLVPDVRAQPQINQAVRIVNAIDPAVTHDHLQTPAGERVIVNIIGRNARAVRAALQG